MVKAYQSSVYPLPLYQLDKIFDKKKIEEHQELAGLFSKNAFEQLHNWQPTTKNRKVVKSIAHGVIGELAARMAGNVPGSGFKVIMTNELLIGEIKKMAKTDPALAQWLSGTVGGVVNSVTGKPIAVGVAEAQYATRFNHLHEFSEEWLLEDPTNGMHQGILIELKKIESISNIHDLSSERGIISLSVDVSNLLAASFLLKQSIWGNGEFQYYDNDSIVSKVFKIAIILKNSFLK